MPQSRHRYRLNIDDTTHYEHKNLKTGVVSPSLDLNTERDEETIDDWVWDHYTKRIQNGEIINNPCEYYREVKESSGSATVSAKYPASGATYDELDTGCVSKYFAGAPHGGNSLQIGPSVSLDTEETLVARAKLQAIASIDKTPYSFGEDMLEVKETLEFLRNPLKGVFELSRSFGAKRKLGASLSDVYLEYRFALSPLIRSVTSALEAYSYVALTQPPRLSARGFARDSNSGNDEVTGVDINKTFWRQLNKTVDVKASILYTVSNPIRDWRWRLGLRVKDYPLTFWQIVPYSFMIDRLYNVSSFCSGVVNLLDPKIRILAGDTRVKTETNFVYSYVTTVASGWVITGTGELEHEKYFSYVRTPWSPSFRDTVPEATWPRIVESAQNILDLVTLTIQRFR